MSIFLLLCLTMVRAQHSQNLGGLSPVRKILFNTTDHSKGEHVQLYELLKHGNVQKSIPVPNLQVIEYQTQVVAGIRYRIILENISESTPTRYELNVWQKPYNSVEGKMPDPEVMSFSQLEELVIDL